MLKPEVDFKKEKLRYVCNEAYFFVRNNTWGRNDKEEGPPSTGDKIGAYFLGFDVGFAAATIGEYVAAPVIQVVAEKVGFGVSLEDLIYTGLGTVGITALHQTHKWFKNNAEKWKEHPLYTKGFIGVMSGATTYSVLKLLS